MTGYRKIPAAVTLNIHQKNTVFAVFEIYLPILVNKFQIPQNLTNKNKKKKKKKLLNISAAISVMK